jgi:hypothetical protein
MFRHDVHDERLQDECHEDRRGLRNTHSVRAKLDCGGQLKRGLARSGDPKLRPRYASADNERRGTDKPGQWLDQRDYDEFAAAGCRISECKRTVKYDIE